MFACIYGQQLHTEVSGTLAGRPSSTPSVPYRWGSRALERSSLAEFALRVFPARFEESMAVQKDSIQLIS